jgi:hypothetical protein
VNSQAYIYVSRIRKVILKGEEIRGETKEEK